MEPHRYDALKSLELRPGFYRRLYRWMLRAVFINSIILCALCVLTVYLGFYGFKAEYYFTTTPSGKIIELRYRTQPPYPKASEESSQSHAQPASVPKAN